MAKVPRKAHVIEWRQLLAWSSKAICSALSCNDAAFAKLWTCEIRVALAIGAVTPIRAISHASATSAGSARWDTATSSSVLRIASPRGVRYLEMPSPRLDLPRSAFERYFPVKKPDARL